MAAREQDGRYRLVDGPEGPAIACINTPNVRLRVERGRTWTRSDVAREPPGTVFLDGACDSEPFHDHGARRYNLDHHAGCLRPVTISTCEQAATMLVLGMPLKEGDWTLHLNEPDPDAVLAAWVFLNHLDLLAADAKLMWEVMPLLRLETVIDVHGLGKEVLAGLPRDVLQRQSRRLEALMEPVRALRADGEWRTMDATDFTLRQLAAVDRMVLPAGELTRLMGLEEAGRVALRGQRVAILCRSTEGIYEVEDHLRQRYGKTLGLVVLDAGEGRFTLRRTDAFLDAGLGALYRLLNRLDPQVTDGDHWGGAEEIGGSPRGAGSGLTGTEILEAVDKVFGKRRSWWRRMFDWTSP